MVDSIAASLIVITWAVRWTSRRSATSITTIAALRVSHTQSGTSNEA